MSERRVHLHGGPLDEHTTVDDDTDGSPAEATDVAHESDGVTWYVQYRRLYEADGTWHYQATGVTERSDEE